jgi:hypothetical protein
VKETKMMTKLYFLLFLISFNVILAKYSKEDTKEDSKVSENDSKESKESNEDRKFKCPELFG